METLMSWANGDQVGEIVLLSSHQVLGGVKKHISFPLWADFFVLSLPFSYDRFCTCSSCQDVVCELGKKLPIRSKKFPQGNALSSSRKQCRNDEEVGKH